MLSRTHSPCCFDSRSSQVRSLTVTRSCTQPVTASEVIQTCCKICANVLESWLVISNVVLPAQSSSACATAHTAPAQSTVRKPSCFTCYKHLSLLVCRLRTPVPIRLLAHLAAAAEEAAAGRVLEQHVAPEAAVQTEVMPNAGSSRKKQSKREQGRQQGRC